MPRGSNERVAHAGGAVTANRWAGMADPLPTGATVVSTPITADRADTPPPSRAGSPPARAWSPDPATPRRAASPETRRLYAADWAAFEDWCRQAGRVWLPADAATVADYLREAATSLSAGALGRRAAAIAARHRANLHPAPTRDPAVRAVLRQARRTATPRRPKPKAAAALIRMAIRCPGDLAGMRDRALLLLAASGLGRAALVGLDVEHIRISATAAVLSQALSGAPVAIGRGADRSRCPVQALQDWLDSSQTLFGPVFRKIDRWGALAHHRLGTDAIRRILARREPHRRAATRPGATPRQRAQSAGGA
jgi:hypothetical protein